MNPFHAKSGYVTDEEVKRRESKLRDALRWDAQFQLKESATVEVAQVRLVQTGNSMQEGNHFNTLFTFCDYCSIIPHSRFHLLVGMK